ncbi:pyruvate decarboxylase isoenzyme [Elsinoe ampelina]|uniref:Pyruvate decarboxylase n=1 Tax=Elsinoe ampelina TaxID=302913 RepID=A0A6A6G2P4_9PEZI|nr:pyruvate decarboxylase isoenzyme [Elsinoe ampelina]
MSSEVVLSPTIAVGEYIWRRIAELGIETIMGLPGDFNLQLLDYIYKVKGLGWIGTGNELNASYAVDGYSRVKNVPGCIVTTHGVGRPPMSVQILLILMLCIGELSALNGIAGSLTEQSKVIHIVGQTTRSMQKNKLMIHHSIGFDPDHQIFNTASKRFRVAEAELWEAENAPAEIDRVIRECILKSGPVYIFIPLDLADERVPSELLKTPLDLSPPTGEQIRTTAERAAKAIGEAILASKNPVIFVDGLLMRHNAVNEARELIKTLGFPVFNSGIGMGILDPNSPQLVGTYGGATSNPGISEAFEASDLLLVLGHLPADTNSGGFSQQMPASKTIDFRPTSIKLLGTTYTDLHPPLHPHPPPLPSSQALTTPTFWPSFSHFLQPHGSILADTGTSLFGLHDATFPSPILYNTQTYYGSIGWATPAAFGAEIARQELAALPEGHAVRGKAQCVPSRTVLVTGDGSIQLTVQEVGSMIHYSAPVVIVVINNDGYTVERAIHGARQGYNDIVPYRWSKALEFFGMDEGEAVRSYVRVETRGEWEVVLKREDLRRPDGVKIVEVVMDKFDAPWRMLVQIGRRGEGVRREMEEGGFVLREARAGESG